MVDLTVHINEEEEGFPPLKGNVYVLWFTKDTALAIKGVVVDIDHLPVNDSVRVMPGQLHIDDVVGAAV